MSLPANTKQASPRDDQVDFLVLAFPWLVSIPTTIAVLSGEPANTLKRVPPPWDSVTKHIDVQNVWPGLALLMWGCCTLWFYRRRRRQGWKRAKAISESLIAGLALTAAQALVVGGIAFVGCMAELSQKL